MTLEKIFWDYGMELLTIHRQVKNRKFYTVYYAHKHFTQAVKDRVKQQSLTKGKIIEIMTTTNLSNERTKQLFLEGEPIYISIEDIKDIAQAIHTEMDKAVEKL